MKGGRDSSKARRLSNEGGGSITMLFSLIYPSDVKTINDSVGR